MPLNNIEITLIYITEHLYLLFFMTIKVKGAKLKIPKYANISVLCCNNLERKDSFYSIINSFDSKEVSRTHSSIGNTEMCTKNPIVGKIRVSTQKSGWFFRNDTGKGVLEKVQIVYIQYISTAEWGNPPLAVMEVFRMQWTRQILIKMDLAEDFSCVADIQWPFFSCRAVQNNVSYTPTRICKTFSLEKGFNLTSSGQSYMKQLRFVSNLEIIKGR